MARYRVFRLAAEQLTLPNGVQLEESYPAFDVVSGTTEAITALRQQYPVEELPEPAARQPLGRTALAAAAGEPVKKGRQDVVVRFKAPIKKEWLKEIEKFGAKVLRPLGGAAVIASLQSQEALQKLRGYDKVDQIDSHVPDIQVSPEVLQGLSGKSDEKALARAAAKLASGETKPRKVKNVGLPGLVVATFLSEADCARARKQLSHEGLREVHDAGESGLLINVAAAKDPGKALEAIAELPGLRRLEDKKMPRLHNNVARLVIGNGVVSSNAGGLGLTGKGELACVADTGLDTGNMSTIHLDFHGRIKDIHSFPIAPSYSSLVTNPGEDDGPADLYSGHGTHTTGSVLGSGARAQALGLAPIQGMAPETKLVFQAIEQTPKWTAQAKLYFINQGMKPPVSGLYGIPDDLGDLFQAAYDQGGRVHSNSWGGGDPGAYDAQCEALDRFVWNHRDFLVVFAAGNDGKEQMPGGSSTIALGSVTPPATAKNCLTVGASENDRAQDFSDTYGAWWPDDFPLTPFKQDSMTDSVDDVVAFSSRGPCANGRRKPDVLAPGTFVLSTRSSQIAANNYGWHAYPPAKNDYMFDGGTSMATPLVAGAAVLVRQYLREKAGISKPSAALVKAAMIHSANYRRFRYADASSAQWADNEQGWGRVNLRELLAAVPPTNVLFFDENQKLATGEEGTLNLNITDPSVPLRVTMVYSDYPGAALINNLNLIVTDPNGQFFLGNDFAGAGTPDALNNVEGVRIASPAAGTWRIRVVASEILQGSQPFALVVSAGGLTLAQASRTAATTRKTIQRRGGRGRRGSRGMRRGQ